MNLYTYAVYHHRNKTYLISENLKTLAWALLIENESGTYKVMAVANKGIARFKQGTFNYSWEVSRQIEGYRTNIIIRLDRDYAYVGGQRYKIYRPLKRASDMVLA